MDDENTIRDILRGSSDGLLIAIREVGAHEQRKRGIRPGDPEFPKLAREVRVAAEALLDLARQEEASAQKTSGTPIGERLPTINESSPPRDLASILHEWRVVERRLEEAQPTSADADRLLERFQSLRTQYAEALEALRRKS